MISFNILVVSLYHLLASDSSPYTIRRQRNIPHGECTSYQYLFHRVRKKRVLGDGAIFSSHEEEVVRRSDSEVIICDNIYDSRFVVGSVLEDSYGAIEADGNELSSIGSVGEERWARSVCLKLIW